MHRRTLLAAAALPLIAERAAAQAPHRIGMPVNGGPGPLHDGFRRAFAEEMAALGHGEGRDFQVEPRFAEGRIGRLPALAAELVQQGCDLMLALGGPAARAAQQATTTVPVVFAIVTDPVALGLVASVERPGGNLTGITSLDPHQADAQFALLRRVFPRIERVAILSDDTIPGADANGMAPIDRANIAAARALGIAPQVVKLRGPGPGRPEVDFAEAFAAMTAERAEAVIVLDTPIPFGARRRIGDLAIAQRLPAMFAGGFGDAGGVITYGSSVAGTWARLPSFIDRIWNGASPADIPVEFLTRRELVFNLRSAAAAGISIPPELLSEADRVIR